MRYFVLLILALAVLGGICFLAIAGFRYSLKRHRQRQLALRAPQLLQYGDLDPKIAELLVRRQKALEAGANIVSQMLNDPVMVIPTMYATPLEEWVNTTRKEIGR